MTGTKIPQLRMVIPDMAAWQVDWEVPAGYEIVTYSEGIENEWLTIINESFNKEFTVDDWRRIMLDKEGYRPDRIFFVKETSSGEICATAAAVRGGGAEHGYLHFVGVRPQRAGLKLGYCVSCAATESFKADGCTDAALNTDAHRSAALKTYLRLGYRPQPRHEAHGEIWTKALREIGFEHIEICPDAL